MLRGILGPMEKHHKVRISDAAIVAAVNLSHRYIPARQLPDKAVSLLDTACARVAISQSATPAADRGRTRRDRRARGGEGRARQRRAISAPTTTSASARLDAEIAALKEKLAGLEAEWATEQKLVERNPKHPRKILAAAGSAAATSSAAATARRTARASSRRWRASIPRSA